MGAAKLIDAPLKNRYTFGRVFHKGCLHLYYSGRREKYARWTQGERSSHVEKAGINLENVKRNNRSAILKLLNARGSMSRKDIAAALGLTPATVTLISNELLAAGCAA